MRCVGFKPTIPAFERAKTVYALDRAATCKVLSQNLREGTEKIICQDSRPAWRDLQPWPPRYAAKLLTTSPRFVVILTMLFCDPDKGQHENTKIYAKNLWYLDTDFVQEQTLPLLQFYECYLFWGNVQHALLLICIAACSVPYVIQRRYSALVCASPQLKRVNFCSVSSLLSTDRL
jgi:hypothetical protein